MVTQWNIDQVDELEELKKKAVYNPTKGPGILRLNKENEWDKYEPK